MLLSFSAFSASICRFPAKTTHSPSCHPENSPQFPGANIDEQTLRSFSGAETTPPGLSEASRVLTTLLGAPYPPPMSFPSRLVSLVGALAGGVAIGWGAGSITSGRSFKGESAAKAAGSQISPAARTDDSQAGDASADAGAERLSPDSPEFLHELRAALGMPDRVDRQIRIEQLVNSLAPGDFSKAYLAAESLPGAQGFLVALGKPWAKVDPEGAANFGATHSVDQNFLASIGAAWGKSAPRDAIAWIDRVAPQPGHGELTFLILNVIAKVEQDNPREAVDLWNRHWTHTAEWVRHNQTLRLYGNWAKQDPEAATTAVLGIRTGERESILTAVAAGLAQTDPQGGLAWAAHLPNSATRKMLTRDIALALAESDPAAAIAWARAGGEESARQQVLEKALAKLAATDVTAALTASKELPPGHERDASLSTVVQAMTKTDVDQAAQLLDQIPAGPDHDSAAASICEAMSLSDPRSALDWIDFHGSMAVLASNTGILQRWFNTSRDDALKWLRALPAGENRDAAFQALANQLARSEPAQAKAGFQQLSPEGQDSASSDLVKRLYEQDPVQARQWAESLPPGNAQATALDHIASEWYKQDPGEVAKWLNTLPPGQGRDSAVSAYSQALAMTDPAKAMSSAMSIDDELDRNYGVSRVVEKWMRADADAARQWINTTS